MNFSLNNQLSFLGGLGGLEMRSVREKCLDF